MLLKIESILVTQQFYKDSCYFFQAFLIQSNGPKYEFLADILVLFLKQQGAHHHV